MSTDFKVELVLECDRTKKEYKQRVSLSEAEELRKTIDNKAQVGAQVHQSFQDILEAGRDLPDLVVVYNGKIAVLPHVSPKNHETLNRLLGDATGRPDLFPRPEPKKRRSSGKRSGEDQAV
jgi:hypothetical protein